jgi:hypothetical protein
MTSITSATHAQTVRIISGTINCKSRKLYSSVVEAVVACNNKIIKVSSLNGINRDRQDEQDKGKRQRVKVKAGMMIDVFHFPLSFILSILSIPV